MQATDTRRDAPCPWCSYPTPESALCPECGRGTTPDDRQAAVAYHNDRLVIAGLWFGLTPALTLGGVVALAMNEPGTWPVGVSIAVAATLVASIYWHGLRTYESGSPTFVEVCRRGVVPCLTWLAVLAGVLAFGWAVFPTVAVWLVRTVGV